VLENIGAPALIIRPDKTTTLLKRRSSIVTRTRYQRALLVCAFFEPYRHDVGAPAFAPFVQGQRLRLLGVTGQTRVPAFPDVKTFAEQGYPDEIFQLRLWMALLAPTGTPRPIVELLHREVVKIIREAEYQAVLANAGFELLANTPDEARANLQRELAIVPRLVKQIGVEPQ